MNALTDAGVIAEDKLFATLDTRTRRWRLPGWGPVLLSDTVGFIRDLPHRLIASFKATLEETRQADLLLHVADASSPLVDAQIAAVRGVLAELGVEDKPAILVLNKIDAIADGTTRAAVLARYPHAVGVSARTGAGLAALARAAADCLGSGFHDVDVETDPGNGRLIAWLAAHGEVLSRHFADDRVTIHCRIPASMVGRIAADEAVVRPHRPAAAAFPGRPAATAAVNGSPLPRPSEPDHVPSVTRPS
jgi:GTP-binding protein HflX